jgi:L,D-transpeptidase ErfK/SrfK
MHCADTIAPRALTGIKPVRRERLRAAILRSTRFVQNMSMKAIGRLGFLRFAEFELRCAMLAAGLLAVAVLPGAPAQASQQALAPADRLAGSEFDYIVQPGDYLIKIGARFGIAAKLIAESNGIPYEAPLTPGAILRLDNRHIVPESMEQGILINIPQRMLFHFEDGALARHFPVGLGRSERRTPVGSFTVASLQADMYWNVPRSIQEEMSHERKVVTACMPPGPDNPLGRHWIGLSIPGFGIHGTIAPASVYHFQSHGCIRTHPDDIAELFQRVAIGTPGWLIYQTVLLARLDDGRVFLEAHRDVYNQNPDPLLVAERLARIRGVAGAVDWEKVREALQRKTGLAVEVGRY